MTEKGKLTPKEEGRVFSYSSYVYELFVLYVVLQYTQSYSSHTGHGWSIN
jgi:hypothetical protein